MSPPAAITLRHYALRSSIPNLLRPCTRRQQSTSEHEKALRTELLKRTRGPKWETLDPRTSYGLSKILSTYLPPSCQARKPPIKLRKEDMNSYVPQGHHQVYFNDLHAESFLLPDGTDKAHYPGPPFEQRLWAGGSLTFNSDMDFMMRYGSVGILQEDIEDVQVKGTEGQEKVFVTISRKVAMYSAIDQHKQTQPSKFPPDFGTLPGTDLENRKLGPLAMEEKKTLVFLRPKTEEERKQGLETVPRSIKPIHKPEFSISITPSAHLLSRFSALTSNAHRIHLDRQYCREVEGHRNLLVHGPLSQVLMLAVLRSRLNRTKGELIFRFDYKNVAPLYVDEEMNICVRRNPKDQRKYDVWIEGSGGGLAVKATAEVGFRFEWKKYYTSKGHDNDSAARVREIYKNSALHNLGAETKPESQAVEKKTSIPTNSEEYSPASRPVKEPVTGSQSSHRSKPGYHIDEPAAKIQRVKTNTVFQRHLIQKFYTGPHFEPNRSVLEPREQTPITPKEDAQQLADLISVLQHNHPRAQNSN